MMKVNQQKQSYTAPKMEATSFKAEQGYATSVTSSNVTITMTGSSL